MTDYLFFLLLGSGAGAIIAAFGLGLLITHQGSGVVNFAFGAMATWSAYVYADLRRGAYTFPFPGLPARYHFAGGDVGFRWALLLALLTSVVMGAAVYLLVFRPLFRAPALAKVVASIGLVIVFISLIERRFADKAVLRVPPILPREPVTISEGLTVPRDGLWLAAIVILIGAGVWVASRYSRVGLVTRAAAENEKGAVLLGYSPTFLAGASFVLSSLIGAFVVILASPMIQLSSGIFTFGFLIPALGAALIGKFRNVWPTVITGLAIGMVQSTFTKMQEYSWFPQYGAREGLPFLVIIVAMVILGERLPDRGSVDTWRLPAVPPAKVTALSVVLPVTLAVVGLFVLGPLWRGAIMTSTIAVVLALSLVILTGFGGQTSLAQMAFAGVAGFSLSKFAMHWNIPFPIAPILAALVAMVFGVLVGLPALRVRGTNLAIITLAGGVAITEFVFKNPKYIGDASTGGAKVPNPKLGNWDLGLILGDQASRPIFGVLLVAVALLLALGVANIRRSASGRRMLAARSNERAASAVGISVARVKLQVFAASSFVAGIGGCLIAYRFGSVSDASFGTIASLTALAVAYLGGITCVSGAVTSGITASAGVAFYGMAQITGSLGQWEALIGGVLLILTAVLNPEGIAGGIRAQVAAARLAKARPVSGVLVNAG